jgi:chemotaxis protein MotA
LQLTAAIIAFGGTFSATFTRFSLAAMRRVPQHLSVVFHAAPFDPVTLIDELGAAAAAYKKADGGFKELEARAARVPDRFVAKGYRLIADGKTGDELRERLETDLWAEHEGLQEGVRIFSTAGGYAPTMGIAGTVMGLIRVLSLLNGSMTSLGSAIGLAFIATLDIGRSLYHASHPANLASL